MCPSTRTDVDNKLHFFQFRINHIANEDSNCGHGIILLARDCMAILGSAFFLGGAFFRTIGSPLPTAAGCRGSRKASPNSAKGLGLIFGGFPAVLAHPPAWPWSPTEKHCTCFRVWAALGTPSARDVGSGEDPEGLKGAGKRAAMGGAEEVRKFASMICDEITIADQLSDFDSKSGK